MDSLYKHIIKNYCSRYDNVMVVESIDEIIQKYKKCVHGWKGVISILN